MISGIILCTVASSNKGTRTRLPQLEEKTFLRHIMALFQSARITDVVIVVDEEVRKKRSDLSEIGSKIALSAPPKPGELSSICVGIDNISESDVHGVMICPVDHPLITQKLLVDLLQNFWHSKKKIIVPAYHGTYGYPVIFGMEFYDVLKTASPEDGVFDIIQKYKNEKHVVNTDENGAILTISSLEEYKKYSGVINA
jgi:molybdenum cofactor cytidylyltransferase